MNPLKQAAKSVLEFGAANLGPHRWPSRKPRLWILMYHRILPADDPRTQEEEPGMVVTPETFRQHIQWLKPEFEIIHLAEWIDRRNNGRPLPPKACAITFDDGWLDNYEYAFPILKETGVPATIFAVSHMVGTKETFWPNRVARLLRNPELQSNRDELTLWLRQCIRTDYVTPMNREEISRVIATLKTLPDAEIQARLDQTEKLISANSAAKRSLVDWEELRTMSDSGLVNIGSHTCHHTRLTQSTPDDVVYREILESQKLLESKLDRPIELFCYPNGDISRTASNIVAEHFRAAVSTARGINDTDDDAHTLARIGLHEQIADHSEKFYARLSGWV